MCKLEVKGWKKIFYKDINNNNKRIEVLQKVKLIFKLKFVIRVKEGYYVMIFLKIVSVLVIIIVINKSI